MVEIVADERGNGLGRMKGNTKKPLRIVLVCVGVVVVAAIVVAVVFWMNSNQQQPAKAPDTGGRATLVVPENVDEVREQLSQSIEDGYYATRMNVDWVFPNSSEPSTNAYVENSTSNTRTVYFDLFLADTNELLYSSPFIPVGAKLEGFALDAELPAGEYSGIVTYHLVDDDEQELSTVSVSVTLRILE